MVEITLNAKCLPRESHLWRISLYILALLAYLISPQLIYASTSEQMTTNLDLSSKDVAMFKRSGDLDKLLKAGEYYTKLVHMKGLVTHKAYCETVNSVTEVYLNRNLFDKALDLNKTAAKTWSAKFGKQNREYATFHHTVGMILYQMGRHTEAKATIEAAYSLRKKILQKNDPDLAGSVFSLGMLADSMGHTAKAEKNYLMGIQLIEQSRGKTHVETGITYSRFANFLSRKGSYSDAIQYYSQSIAVYSRNARFNRAFIAESQMGLAIAMKKKGLYDSATAYLLKSIATYRSAFGQKHPKTASAISNLGGVYAELGLFNDALGCVNTAAGIYADLYGNKHRISGLLLNNAGYVLTALGNYKEGRKMIDSALRRLPSDVGEKHPIVANALVNLAVIDTMESKIDQACLTLAKANTVYHTVLNNMMGAGREREKIAYLQSLQGKTDFAIWLGAMRASENKHAARVALNTLLQRKGRVMDAMAATQDVIRKRLTEPQRLVYEDILKLRSELAQMTYAGTPENTKVYMDMQEKLAGMERQLGKVANASLANGARITATQIKRAIPKETVVLEFIRFLPFDVRIAKALRHQIEPHYAVCLLSQNGLEKWIDLGEASGIENAILSHRRAILGRDEKEALASGRKLYELVFQPFAHLVEQSKRLLISPDSALNVVPFGALTMPDGKYLITKFDISYLSVSRDLLEMRRPRSRKGSICLVGNPKYAAHYAGSGTRNSRLSKQAKRQTISPLPGTAVEIKKLAALFPTAKVYTAKNASEQLIKSMAAPRVLHMATHGFFLPNQKFEFVVAPTTQGNKAVYVMPAQAENPLIRSGLVFAGADHLSYGSEDGILTAMEITGIDFNNTELVVMSACETGLGDLVAGEGVFGLRRAFMIAGSRSTVMTLWSISDEASIQLMESFYKTLKTGASRSESLRKAQIDMLGTKWKHPVYWAAFTLSGDWRSM